MAVFLRLSLLACLTWFGWGRLAMAGQVWAAPPVCDPNRQWQVEFAAQTQIGGETFYLEVATTPEQQAQGLMFRTELGSHQGMVFVFDPPQRTGFWMWQTCLNLDIIFLSQGRVVEIAADVPPCRQQPCPVYGPPTQLIDQVVELRGGTAQRLGLKPGDPLMVVFTSPRSRS